MFQGGLYVVAGASGAIGKALCRRIVLGGGTPVLVGRSADKLKQVADEIDCPSAGIISNIDFMNPVEAGKQLSTEFKGVPSINGLAYAVGSITLKPLRASKTTDYLDSYTVNVLGAVELIKAALPALKKGASSGSSDSPSTSSIVLFSSIAASNGLANHGVIGSSKGAIEGLTKSLAAELVPQSVRVNCVAPSLTKESAMGLSMTSNEKMAEAIAKAHPLPRLGNPDDSAAAAAYLLSNEVSSWVTGTILPVDGGRSTILK